MKKLWIPAVCGALVFALTLGTRQSQALFIGPINSATGLGIGAISLAFGVAQLMWGVAQPIAGAIADKHGSGRVLVAGALLVAIGTALVPLAQSQLALILAIGVLAAGGAGAAGPSVIMSAVNRRTPLEKRGMATGLVNAGGSLGQFLIVPLAAALIGALGWVGALQGLALLPLAILALAWVLRGKPQPQAGGESLTLSQSVKRASRDSSFWLLIAGFFTCGFHVAFIATHLPGVVASCALPTEVAAWSLAVIGLFNVFGSFFAGWAISRWRSKRLLSALYGSRALAVALFLVAPKTELTFLVFAAVIGFTYLSTVPPTVALVAKLQGATYVATLFGFVMLAHQVGGFLGAWLGGKAFDWTGSYGWMWYADIALALAAAAVNWPIREQRLRPQFVAAPA
jgi:predicted MFS family arabinose efflux permease